MTTPQTTPGGMPIGNVTPDCAELVQNYANAEAASLGFMRERDEWARRARAAEAVLREVAARHTQSAKSDRPDFVVMVPADVVRRAWLAVTPGPR